MPLNQPEYPSVTEEEFIMKKTRLLVFSTDSASQIGPALLDFISERRFVVYGLLLSAYFLLAISASAGTQPPKKPDPSCAEILVSPQRKQRTRSKQSLQRKQRTQSKQSLRSIRDELRTRLEELASLGGGLTDRGFFSFRPETPRTNLAVEELGVTTWIVYIHGVHSLDEAKSIMKDHYLRYKDTMMHPIFVLLPQEVTALQSLSPEDAEKIMISQGAYFFKDPQNLEDVVYYTPETLGKTLNPEIDRPAIGVPSDGTPAKLVLSGYAFPVKRGIIDPTRTFQATEGRKESPYDKLWKSHIKTFFTNLVYEKPKFKVTFNRAQKETLDALKNQTRKHKASAENRYYDAHDPEGKSATYRTVEKRLAENKAFTVEVWFIHDDGTEELVAGTVVTRSTNNIFSPDTVHYKDEITFQRQERSLSGKPVFENGQPKMTTKTIHGIDLAKIAALATIDRLLKSGVKFIDAGMVTSFTRSIGGHYVDRDAFLQLMSEIPRTPISVPKNDWVPPQAKP